MNPLAWVIGAGIVTSLWSGYSNKRAAEKSGNAQRDVYYANAQDLLQFANINYSSILGAANRNAQAILTVGEANAMAIENARDRNLFLYGLQADEEVRRHIIAERMTAGTIRAMSSASGVQVNTGSPLYKLHAEIDEGIRQRRFMVQRHFYTMEKMYLDETERAYLTRLTSSENAAVVMANAQAQADVSLADAYRQYNATLRQGDLAAELGDIQGDSALLQGIANAANIAGKGYIALSGSPGTATAAGGPSQQALLGSFNTFQNAFTFMNPYSSMTAAGASMAGYGSYGGLGRLPTWYG